MSSTRLREQREETVGFLARSDASSGSKPESLISKSRFSCSHCGRSGHEKRDCWQLVAFPDWWTERSEKISAGRGSGGRGRGRGTSYNVSGRGRVHPVAAHATSSNSSVFSEFTARFLNILIGSGEECDSVYYLTDVATKKFHMASVATDHALWHRRLGHPSFSVLSALPLFSGSSSSVSSTIFLTIVDDFSHAVWTFLLLEKSEVRRVLTNFMQYTEKQFVKAVKTSCVAKPQQNGRVERKHHKLNAVRALLFSFDLLVLLATFIVLVETKINLASVVVCVFLLDIHLEDFFPYASPVSSLPLVSDSPSSGDDDWLVSPSDVRGSPVATPPISIVQEVSPDSSSSHDLSVTADTASPDSVSFDLEPIVPVPIPSTVVPVPGTVVSSSRPVDDQTMSATLPAVPAPPQRQSQRSSKPLALLNDYILYNVTYTPSSSNTLPDSSSLSSASVPGISLSPLTDYFEDNFTPAHRVYLAAITDNNEPKHFKEAVQFKVWNDAMSKEVDALEVNKTGDLVDLPPNKVAIGGQWIYKTKYNSDGTVERYKARLVGLGNNQIEGEDYKETFALVVHMTTVRTLLRLVAAKNWEVYQMDVHNAFLHGDLDEEVYIKLPPRFRHSHPGKVWRLHKSLYGLEQAPRCWFKKLSDSLLRFGFFQSYEDYSLFSYTRNKIEICVLIYVDDPMICGNDGYMLKKFKDYLSRCFSMKDLGKLKYFLGLQVSCGSDGFFLTQCKYALDIVADSGDLASRLVFTPLE
ncbi:PREDICTED: uncharacterized protein LOC104779171 [Camelina sativa]|uniref:Uncharacterized protein LOC104779171 n=1 Tax=Camelina sativa TaxID=90675 RepID=A0ABM0YJC3_CAMSA|nr:PREDICTED: uncharacterized protein LOC104779171 [Camelina sativa]